MQDLKHHQEPLEEVVAEKEASVLHGVLVGVVQDPTVSRGDELHLLSPTSLWFPSGLSSPCHQCSQLFTVPIVKWSPCLFLSLGKGHT